MGYRLFKVTKLLNDPLAITISTIIQLYYISYYKLMSWFNNNKDNFKNIYKLNLISWPNGGRA